MLSRLLDVSWKKLSAFQYKMLETYISKYKVYVYSLVRVTKIVPLQVLSKNDKIGKAIPKVKMLYPVRATRWLRHKLKWPKCSYTDYAIKSTLNMFVYKQHMNCQLYMSNTLNVFMYCSYKKFVHSTCDCYFKK